MYLNKFIQIYLAAFLCCFSSGCVFLVVGAAGAVGGYAISRDTFEGVSAKSQEELLASAHKVLSIMGTITDERPKDGEIVDFHAPFVMTGPVERWLNELTVMQQDSLKVILEAAVEAAVNWEVEKPRHTWLEDYPAQVALVGSQIYWTEETQAALDELEAGTEDAVKRYLGVCNDRLHALINRVLGDLKPDLRTKIIALITLDVHARDVVQKLIDSKVRRLNGRVARIQR